MALAPAARAMIYTLFTSRLNELTEAQQQHYEALSEQLLAAARAMPGFVDQRRFTGEDGERLTIVRFRDRASHEAWRRLPQHRRAQELGRRSFYASYEVVVCESWRETAWPPAPGPGPS